jgi:hypothetical protein
MGLRITFARNEAKGYTAQIIQREPPKTDRSSPVETQTQWSPAGPDVQSVLAQMSDPLLALSQAEIPAIILRQAYDPGQCQALMRRFTQWGLMRDPQGKSSADKRTRIDVGTSLGNRGHDKEGFLTHAAATHDLFRHLFNPFDDPVETLYASLQSLAKDKKVQVAHEADGRRYGPAIFRIHYETHSYKPHFDHVTLREKRFDYAVSRFEHQFAGILCLQNASQGGRSAQTILHRSLWTPDVQSHLDAETFHAHAAANQIEQYRVELAPGDLYFFNSRCIHEIPPLDGNDPRAVLAVFIGYSPEDNEIYVWS